MMDKGTIGMNAMMAGMLILFSVVWYSSGVVSCNNKWKAECIERGHAIHDPITGDFTWKDKLDD